MGLKAEAREHRPEHHSNRAVMRQSGLTGVAAFAGVIAGLVLDISIAFRFGAGQNTDAFFIASRIPLGLAAVVMAAANQALVPAFRTSMTKRGRQQTSRLISMVVCAILAAGGALTLLAWLIAVPLMRVTAPGVSEHELSLAASMVPVVFAMVPLIAVAEVLRAHLNASYAFVAPALMTVVLNGLAAAMILVAPILGWHKDIHLVAFAFLAGAVAQAGFMWLMSVRQGLRFRPALDMGDEHLRSVGALSVRPLAAAGLNPVARLGEQLIVSFLPVGSITILNYGYMLVSAIGGTVFFRSVIVALLPRLTDAHNRGDREGVLRFTRLGMQVMLAISLPLTAFMAVLAKPAVIAVFHRGSFTEASAALLGTVLAVYSVSLVGSALQRALLAPFFARLDTRTPLRTTFYGTVANMLLLPVLVLPFGLSNRNAIIGVALAFSLAVYVNVAHAWYHLARSDGPPARGLLGFTLRLTVASVVSAAAMIGASIVLHLDQTVDRVSLLILTPVAGLIGLAVLLGAMYVLAGREIAGWRVLLRRRRPAGAVMPDSVAGGAMGSEALVDVALSEAEVEGQDEAEQNAPIGANLP